jgi:hypothetical protein
LRAVTAARPQLDASRCTHAAPAARGHGLSSTLAALAALLLSIAALASAPGSHAAARAACVLTWVDAAPAPALGPCQDAARRRACAAPATAPRASDEAALARRAAMLPRLTSMPPPARA